MIFFLFLDENICCGYSSEAPRGTSNEYPQHMFSSRNKKDISIFRMKNMPYLLLCWPPACSEVGSHIQITWLPGHPWVILELSEREMFCNNYREKFWSKFWISLYMYILYIFTSPSAQDREKSASLRRLFFPIRPLG